MCFKSKMPESGFLENYFLSDKILLFFPGWPWLSGLTPLSYLRFPNVCRFMHYSVFRVGNFLRIGGTYSSYLWRLGSPNGEKFVVWGGLLHQYHLLSVKSPHGDRQKEKRSLSWFSPFILKATNSLLRAQSSGLSHLSVVPVFKLPLWAIRFSIYLGEETVITTTSLVNSRSPPGVSKNMDLCDILNSRSHFPWNKSLLHLWF